MRRRRVTGLADAGAGPGVEQGGAALLDSIIRLDDSRDSELRSISGLRPIPIDSLPGCAFRDRCPHRMPVRSEQRPALEEVRAGHKVACFLH